MTTSNFTLTLELDRSSANLTGTAILLNKSDTAITLWNKGNEWGDQVLSFLIEKGASVHIINQGEKVYTRNVPSTLLLKPGGIHKIDFDLTTSEWESDAPIDEITLSPGKLKSLYTVPVSDHDVDPNIWTGQLVSNTLDL